MRFPLAILAALVVMISAPALAEQYSGTWNITPSDQAGSVQLDVRYSHVDAHGNSTWEESRTEPLSDMAGLSSADLNSGGQHRSFAIVRDAGTLQADGWVSAGRGAGTWTYRPNGNFAAELRRRGVGAPSEQQQFELTMGMFKLSTLDELLASGMARPSIDDLVAMGEHGVTDHYIQEMRGLKLRPNSIGSLIRMRDHGVNGSFAAAALQALPRASIDDLISMRDHGVNTRYLAALKQYGYRVNVDQAVALRDHGVSDTYIEDLARIGYRPSAEDLVRLRDHGVSASFIERLRSHGYTKLSVDDLIRLRDSGF